MKTIILAGGLGTRIPEYTHERPKSMIKIGNAPLLTHIMRIYVSYGFKEFIIAIDCYHFSDTSGMPNGLNVSSTTYELKEWLSQPN